MEGDTINRKKTKKMDYLTVDSCATSTSPDKNKDEKSNDDDLEVNILSSICICTII